MIKVSGLSNLGRKLHCVSSGKIAFRPGKYPGVRCGVSVDQFHFLVSAFQAQLAGQYQVASFASASAPQSWNPPTDAQVFYCDQLDHISEVALSSCNVVVSFDWDVVEEALDLGLKCFLVALDRDTLLKAELSKVPHVSIDHSLCPKQWMASFSKFYPILHKRPLPLNLGPEDEHTLHLCSQSDYHYAPSLFGLIENVLCLGEKNVRFHILDLDGTITGLFHGSPLAPLVTLYRLEDIYSPSELEKLKRRTQAEQAFTSKGPLLSHVLEQKQSTLLYIDVDLFFFRSPRSIFESHPKSHTLLFPHWNDVHENFRLHGIYNAGLLRVGPGAENFLKWWSDLCLERCVKAEKEGHFVDQGYLDLAPLYFRGIGIYRAGDENMGAWNIRTLYDTHLRLGSFHAAHPDRLGIFEIKSVWDQIVCFGHQISRPNKRHIFFKRLMLQQSPYKKNLEHCLAISHFLAERLGLGFFKADYRFVSFWLDSRLSRLLLWTSKMVRALGQSMRRRARFSGSYAVHAINADKWVRMQREALQELHPLSLASLHDLQVFEKMPPDSSPPRGHYLPFPQAWRVGELEELSPPPTQSH